MRINIFGNGEPLYKVVTNTGGSNGQLFINHVYIPGSISFNGVAVIKSIGNNANTLSISFGLYSLNGSTLSLANSASQSNNMLNNRSWVTLITSATQDITPGEWYFAIMSSTSGSVPALFYPTFDEAELGAYGGPFYQGVYSVTTGGLPASIATSEMSLAGSGVNTLRNPYILISA